MNHQSKLIFALTFTFVQHGLGQDTVKYCQTNSPWVSNCFHFYKTNKNVDSGIVEKVMSSDDGQNWYGLGKFSETKNKIVVQPINLVRTKYYFQGDNFVRDSLTNDTTLIPKLIFHKRKEQIMLKGGKRKNMIFLKYSP